MIEKNIGKRYVKKARFIKTKSYSTNVFKNLNIAKLSIGLYLNQLKHLSDIQS